MKRLLSLITAVALMGIITISTTKAAAATGPMAQATVAIAGQPSGDPVLYLSKDGTPGSYSSSEIVLDAVTIPYGQPHTVASAFYASLTSHMPVGKSVMSPSVAAPIRYRINAVNINDMNLGEDVHVSIKQGVPGEIRTVFDGTVAQLQSDHSDNNYVYMMSESGVETVNVVYSEEPAILGKEAVKTPNAAGLQLKFGFMLTQVPY